MKKNIDEIAKQQRIVLYDGKCKLCNSWVKLIIRHDKAQQIQLAAVQNSVGKALLNWAGLPEEEIHTLVLIDHGKVSIRSAAILRVMAYLSFPWRACAALRLFPRPIGDFFYDAVAKRRYQIFGQYNQVNALQADHPHRFLS